MKDKKNNYDFSQVSRSGEFGFEAFQNEDNGRYYFHLNDRSGEAFLYSQAYQSGKSRDHGIQAVIRNAPKSERYLKEQEGDLHYFLLKSGNHQEIARSRAFDSRSEMNTCLALLSDIGPDTPIHAGGLAASDQENQSPPAKEFKEKRSPRKPIAKSEDSEQMPRHSFRINLYPESQRGIITHIFSGENRHFQDIDGQEIVNFIKSKIDPPSSGPEITEETLQPEKEAVKVTPQPQPQPVVASKSVPVLSPNTPFSLWVRDREVSGKTVQRNEFYRFALQLDQRENTANATFNTRIIAKPLEPGRGGAQIIMEEHGSLDQSGELSLPISFRRLPENGFYQVTAFISMKNQKTTYQANRLLFVN